ncbi:MAG: hypothetical protein WC876_10140 [Candidatus Thermoplasmatota archaeon]
MDGGLWGAAAISLGLAAALAFMAFGVFLAAAKPRRRLSLPLAGFALGYGFYLALFKLAPGPEGFGWFGDWAITAGQIASGVSGAFLLFAAGRLYDLRSDANFAAAWIGVSVVALAFLNFWFVYAYATPGASPQEVLGTPFEAALQLAAGFGAFAAAMVLAWMAIFGVQGTTTIPASLAILGLALVPQEGLFYGWYFVGDADAAGVVVLADALMLGVVFAVGAAWLYLRQSRRADRWLWFAALACFVFPCIGALTAIVPEPWDFVLANALSGLVGLGSVALLRHGVQRHGLLEVAPAVASGSTTNA